METSTRLPSRIFSEINPAEQKIWLIFELTEFFSKQKFPAKLRLTFG